MDRIPTSAGLRSLQSPGQINLSKENQAKMREREREIKRRRQRYEKRKKLRAKLAAAGEGDRPRIEEKIRKTYPKYTPAI
jgi:uncharacterized protein DUF6800